MSSRALRKLQNDEQLLESILNTSGSERSTPTPVSPPKAKTNMFALMNDEIGDDIDSSEEQETSSKEELEKPVQPKVKILTKGQKKSKNKRKAPGKAKNVQPEKLKEASDGEDEELDKIIQQFRKEDIQKYGVKESSDEYQTASEDEGDLSELDSRDTSMADLMGDSGFSKFPYRRLKHCKRFFNADFKKLDPHSEFKLLFDDLTTESLEDIDSMTTTHVTPQQLKQIQRMKRLLKNWGGRDHRSVPNGPGATPHRLQFTKVREDWLPTPRGELGMRALNLEDLREWQMWQRPNDWKDIIDEDTKAMKSAVSFYKFEPLDPDINRKAITEFYLSTIMHPDHEALVHLISSKYPYHVPALLQVALILVRQGDRSNTNGLIQRALFVFDRALRANIQFDSLACQLPYIYFFNRQFYLAIFRNILTLAQRGAVATAGEWCKALWSLSPLEDPLGCRYYIDHYLLLNHDYQYLIDLSKSPLSYSYKQWCTVGITLGAVLSYLRVGLPDEARKALRNAFSHHRCSLSLLYKEKLLGEQALTGNLEEESTRAEIIEMKAYMARFSLIWTNADEVSFLREELTTIYGEIRNKTIKLEPRKNSSSLDEQNCFFVEDIPVNLLRFAILSEEPSVMGSLPSDLWEKYDVYEFDVLPPAPTSKDSAEVLETVKSFINDRDLAAHQVDIMQDESLLNQIRQMSLEQYLEENPNAGVE